MNITTSKYQANCHLIQEPSEYEMAFLRFYVLTGKFQRKIRWCSRELQPQIRDPSKSPDAPHYTLHPCTGSPTDSSNLDAIRKSIREFTEPCYWEVPHLGGTPRETFSRLLLGLGKREDSLEITKAPGFTRFKKPIN